jgi:hypothetical protein
VSDVTRLTPIVLAAAGVVLFVVAAAAGSNPLYGAADLLVGVALAIFALWPAPPDVRSEAALRGGLALASAAAIIDGLLTVSDQVGTATNVLTWVIVAGLVAAVLGRGVFRR